MLKVKTLHIVLRLRKKHGYLDGLYFWNVHISGRS